MAISFVKLDKTSIFPSKLFPPMIICFAFVNDSKLSGSVDDKLQLSVQQMKKKGGKKIKFDFVVNNLLIKGKIIFFRMLAMSTHKVK